MGDFYFCAFCHAGLVSASHRIDCFSREILKQVQDDNGMLLLPVIFIFVLFVMPDLFRHPTG